MLLLPLLIEILVELGVGLALLSWRGLPTRGYVTRITAVQLLTWTWFGGFLVWLGHRRQLLNGAGVLLALAMVVVAEVLLLRLVSRLRLRGVPALPLSLPDAMLIAGVGNPAGFTVGWIALMILCPPVLT